MPDYPPDYPPGAPELAEPDFDYELGYEPLGFEELINRLLGIERPSPFMESFYGATGLGPEQIGSYITRMFAGGPAKKRAGEFEERGLADVNRLAAQMFRRERLRSAATGGRGSSAEAALKARGVGELAGARAGVRGEAAELETMLSQMFHQRGMGALGMWQGAERGDIQQLQDWGQLMLGTTGPVLGQQALQQQDLWNTINFWLQQQELGLEYPEQED